MGTQISTLYGCISGPPPALATRVADFFEREYEGRLSRHFAQVRRSSRTGSFEFWDEVSDLAGRADLDQRLRRAGAGVFTYELDLGFAPSEAQVIVLRDDAPSLGASERGAALVVNFEKELTSYLFTSDVTHEPFATVLVRIAAAVDALCFVAGAEYDRWRNIAPNDLMQSEVYGGSPQVLGWRDGSGDAPGILKAVGADPAWLERTIDGYCYVSLLGRYKQRYRKA